MSSSFLTKLVMVTPLARLRWLRKRSGILASDSEPPKPRLSSIWGCGEGGGVGEGVEWGGEGGEGEGGGAEDSYLLWIWFPSIEYGLHTEEEGGKSW